MFSNSIYRKLNQIVFSSILILLFSCEKDINLSFSEINLLVEKDAVVEINIPKIDGSNDVAAKINKGVEDFVKRSLQMDSNDEIPKSLEESIAEFNSSYLDFKNKTTEEAKENLIPWEASIEGEISYLSNQVLCIAMNKYLNTGGVHGTLKISFLNFDINTGEPLFYKDFINDEVVLKAFLKPYLEKETVSIIVDDYNLPETIGLNDDGVVILYNINEIPSITNSLVEFTVPFKEINSLLKIY